MNRKSKVAGMLQRYHFVDFAEAISTAPDKRKDFLRDYVDRDRSGRWATYSGLRSMVPDIAGVKRGLDPTGMADFATIQEGLKLRCHPKDLGFNTEAAKCLFDFLRSSALDAYDDHPRASLRIAPDRTIQMGVEHSIVDGDYAAFRYLHPRKSRLEGHLPDIIMSLIHHNYVRDDYSDFGVEIIDISCEPIRGPRGGMKVGTVRTPRILRLEKSNILPRELLNEEADKIYAMLMEIADET